MNIICIPGIYKMCIVHKPQKRHQNMTYGLEKADDSLWNDAMSWRTSGQKNPPPAMK